VCDHVLQAGDSRVFCGNASLLLGALQASQLRLEWLGPLPLQQVAGWRARFSLLMRRCWQHTASRFYTGSTELADAGYHKESSGVKRGTCRAVCEKLD